MASGARDDIDKIIDELVTGPDACEGRYTGHGMTNDCGQPATHIVYIDGGRGDGLDTFCPSCGDGSYAAKGVFAHWVGTRWIKAIDLPRWASPDPEAPADTPNPHPYPYRRTRGADGRSKRGDL